MAGLEAYQEISKHMMGYTQQSLPQLGFFHANCEDQIMLVWGTRENQYGIQEGRWLVRYQGEHSYVGPQLFKLISDYTHDEILGQTMLDGTIMSVEKSKQLASLKKNYTDIIEDAGVKKEGTGCLDHSQSTQQSSFIGEIFETVQGNLSLERTTSVTGSKSKVRQRHKSIGVKIPQSEGISKPKTTRRPRKTTNCVRNPVDGGCGIVEVNQSKIKEEDVAVRGSLNKEKMAQKITKLYIKNKVKLEKDVGGDGENKPKETTILEDEKGLQCVEEGNILLDYNHTALSYLDHQKAASIGRAFKNYELYGRNTDEESSEHLESGYFELKDFGEEIGVVDMCELPVPYSTKDLEDEEEDIRRSCVEVVWK
jgi:hypothetical protein